MCRTNKTSKDNSSLQGADNLTFEGGEGGERVRWYMYCLYQLVGI